MPKKNIHSTHQAVQEYYGRAAREGTSCCSPAGGSAEIQNDLYPLEMLQDLPADIASFTAGSGNPITLAELKAGEHVLDLGSGAGLDCFLAARQVGNQGLVIGVDMTPDMLARARSNAARLSLANVEFRKGYLEDLPVEDSSIDAVISNCVINLSPDKPKVFKEIFRVLKPGGRLAASDIVTNHPLCGAAFQVGDDWCGCQSGALTRQEFISGLEQAGFQQIRLDADLETVRLALAGGQARVQADKTPSIEEILARVQNMENLPERMFIPHRISARKPD